MSDHGGDLKERGIQHRFVFLPFYNIIFTLLFLYPEVLIFTKCYKKNSFVLCSYFTLFANHLENLLYISFVLKIFIS